MVVKRQALVCGLDALTQRAVAGTLAQLDFEVGCSGSHGEALALAARSPIAVLIIALDGAGPDLARTLAMLSLPGRDGQDPPVVIGLAIDSRQAATAVAGLDACVALPLDADALAACIVRLGRDRAPGPAAVPAPPAASIDADVLARLRRYGAEAVAEIYGTLREELPQYQLRLGAAITAGDLAAIGREAHTLKGASGSVGLLALSACCAELVGRSHAGDLAGALALQPRLAALVSQAGAAVVALLAESPPPAPGGRP